ncbi:hypothetical protein CRUP_034808, partial [Coryphaenoides rupestris]
MDTENHLECKSLGGDSRNLVNGVTDMSPPEDRVCDDVLGSNSVAFNRKEPSEEMETDEWYRREDEARWEALSEPQDLSLGGYRPRYDGDSLALRDMDMLPKETSPRSSCSSGGQSGSHKL